MSEADQPTTTVETGALPEGDRPIPFSEEPQSSDPVPANQYKAGRPAGAKKRWAAAVWIFAGVFVIWTIVVIAAVQFVSARRGSDPTLPSSGGSLPVANPSPVELSNTFREIAKALKPAVVYIRIVERVDQGSGIPDIFGLGPRTPRSRPGSGSGFIVTDDGYIMTNDHVVGSADRIEVTLSDGRRLRATLVGSDPETDLAVVRIDASSLQPAILGNSDEVQQGDWVLAMGSPFGLQQSLTAGIISATSREGVGPQFSNFIQTDASINPGNSGGPLVNMRGEVIGINSMIYSPTGSGGNVGIGFAVSSNVARGVFSELVKTGKVTRGYLGVTIEQLDEPRARSLGVEPNSGVLVADVADANSPAGLAGLKSGDVITAFDGRDVRTPRELTDAVAATPVGKTARVDFIRGGSPQSVSVKVAERPSNVRSSVEPPPQPQGDEGQAHAGRLGLSAQNVTPQIASQLQLSTQSGVLVRTVEPGSPAEEAGIAHGDVIHRLGSFEVKSTQDLMQAVAALRPGEETAVQIERRGRMMFRTITVD